jgi:prepilin-type N-terminal cleavage/methylation domain-containing protein/prepilin-type processing-associated H-X9-DG protein
MKLKSAHRPNPAGFTLVELLVCMGIIGVLAGILGTSVSKTKASGQNAVCKNNLMQFGVALSGFVQERGVYPLQLNYHRGDDKYDGQASTWIRSLFPTAPVFTGESAIGVFDCPAANRPSAFPKELDYAEYAYNSVGLIGSPFDDILGLGGMGSSTEPFGDPVREADVKTPAHLLAIGDAFVGWNQVIADGKGTGRIASTQDFHGSTARAPRRHRAKANFAMCDGHVASFTLQTLFAETTDDALSLWTRDGLAHRERIR